MSRTAWSPDKRQIPPVVNQLAIFQGTLHADIKATIRMWRKCSFYSYNFQEDTFRDCGEISDWNTVKLSKVPMFPHRRWEAAATYIQSENQHVWLPYHYQQQFIYLMMCCHLLEMFYAMQRGFSWQSLIKTKSRPVDVLELDWRAKVRRLQGDTHWK